MKKLTFYERLILEYIAFRTNNNRFFFEKNETIAKCFDMKESSAKVLINNLIRAGYLIKSTDGKHRRVLKLSGMEFPRLPWVNMSGVRDYGLKKELDDQIKEYKRTSEQLMESQHEALAEREEKDAWMSKYTNLKKEYDNLKEKARSYVSDTQKEIADKTKLIENVEKQLVIKLAMNEEQIKIFWQNVNTFDQPS